jgi:soluble lytic murein transglycosylase-like protein
MRRSLLFIGVGAVALLAARRAAAVPGVVGSAAESALGALDDAIYSAAGLRVMSGRWLDAAARPENSGLVAAMHEAEARYGIPADLVVRLAWQESRFNPEAYNAGSGASGIMQIVPRWHPAADPWEPVAAIDYGARYLAQLARQFGTWELALKAYNWGPGNVAAWLRGGPDAPVEPLETQNYSAQILADLAEAGRVIA